MPDMNQQRVDTMIQQNHQIKQRDNALKRSIIKKECNISLIHWITENLCQMGHMKENKKIVFQELLIRYHREGDDLLMNTGNYSWILPLKTNPVHNYDPENKGNPPRFSNIKKLKTVTSAKKVIFTIFWNTKV